jgi:GTPase SAR1 family protein
LTKPDPALHPEPTIGSNYESIKVDIKAKGKTISKNVELWDTAGQERYQSLVKM